MMAAIKRGLRAGVVGYPSAWPTYDQFSFSESAINLASVAITVEEKWPCVACPFGAFGVVPCPFGVVPKA
jgi:hypothetical protein